MARRRVQSGVCLHGVKRVFEIECCGEVERLHRQEYDLLQ